ncbi:MAG TPA: hypothetical protein VGZ29_11985 [Terriglobia bacterium]|nr:hypothetical protein [Terriglobia bacterium]
MLRRSPKLTPASLAARRANALKSTGPRTEQGKARVALNPLRHGRYAVNLPERLTRAGCLGDEWRKIRTRIAQIFEPTFRLPESRASGPAEPGPGTGPGSDPGFGTAPDFDPAKAGSAAGWRHLRAFGSFGVRAGFPSRAGLKPCPASA